MGAVRAMGAAVIAYFDQLSASGLTPHLPRELAVVPRANIEFLPLKDAWFSGSMNYVGRARDGKGSPKYEATYEINASLQMSFPEFQQLVSHEVVPGHVTTFAYLQNLYVRGVVGFEATVLTMNTRAASLFEGIANNAILIAHGVTEVEQLPDKDVQIGVLLALLQDDAKNQSSYLTWGEGRAKEDVARSLRRDFLVSEERADKLSGAWGRHPLLDRMYLPAYRAGTESGGTAPAPSCRVCAARNLRLQRAGGYRNCGAGAGRKIERIKISVRHSGSAPRGLNTLHEAQKLCFATAPFVRAVIQKKRLSARQKSCPETRRFSETSFLQLVEWRSTLSVKMKLV